MVAHRWAHDDGLRGVYGIPQGGSVPAVMVARHLNLPILDQPGPSGSLVVDDIVDSGITMARYEGQRRDALYRKPHAPVDLAPAAPVVSEWIVFPWERDGGEPTDAVVRLLEHIGEDPTRNGLKNTPLRVLKALREMTDGYTVDPASVLSTTFDLACDEMVVLQGIAFTSLCEHHMLPFTGHATVGYIPSSGRILGLSKLARVVDVFAHRLQVQERMTTQIAEAIEAAVDPIGVGVVVRAEHSCMACRGVRKPGAQMVTSSMLRLMRDDSKARSEFLSLASV
jgi:GTP cyclohydrolase I